MSDFKVVSLLDPIVILTAGPGISAGTQSGSTGTIVFANSNGVTFGMSGSSQITASVVAGGAGYSAGVSNIGNTLGNTGTVSNQLILAGGNNITLSQSTNVAGATVTISAPAAQIGISGIIVSNTTYTSGTVSFSNANGISFGSSAGQAITASYTVPTQTNQTAGIYASSQTFGQSSSSTHDARSLSVVGSGGVSVGWSNSSLLISGTTYPAQSNQSAIRGLGASNTGNTAGNTGISTGIDWVVAGSNNITISESTAGGGPNTLWISGPTVGGAQTGISGIVVSNTTYTSGTVSFSNANGISFGSSAGQAITASYTVPTQTNQTAGIYASSQTYGQSSSSTYDARSLSVVGSGGVSVGWSNSSLLISGQTTAAQTNQSAIKGWGASNTGNTAGNTGISTGIDWVLAGSNNITISESTAAGGPNTLWVSGPTVGGAQTGISGIVVSNTTYTSGTVSFSNANGISFGSSAGQAITASYTVPTVTNSSWTVSDAVTSGTVGRLAFTNLNGMTLSLSTGAGGSHTIVGSYTVPTQTNQTAGIYASSQTVGQSSSSTYDARSLSVVGQGIVSVGWSNSSLLISATTPAQTVQTEGIYIAGNTTGQSSSSTYDARTLNMSGAGIASVGWSAGSLIVSVPAGGGGGDGYNIVSMMSSTSGGGTAGATFSTLSGSIGLMAGSNITLSQTSNTIVIDGPPAYSESTLSVYEITPCRGGTTTQTLQNGTFYFQPFMLSNPVSAYQLVLLNSMTGQSSSTWSVSGSISGGNSTTGAGSFGESATVVLFSRQSTGTNANSTNLASLMSATTSWSIGMSETLSWSTNASSATASLTTSGAMGYLANIGSAGGFTTSSFTTSGTTSFSSTSTNANSFSTSFSNSFASAMLSGVRPNFIPWATSLAPGEYWLGIQKSTNTGSTVDSRLVRILNMGTPGVWAYQSLTQGYAELGVSASFATSNLTRGWGSGNMNSVTTTTFGMNSISNMSNLQTYFQMVAKTN